jgi:ubiquinone/menaquinone biosynthesis C-methylase UbiE
MSTTNASSSNHRVRPEKPRKRESKKTRVLKKVIESKHPARQSFADYRSYVRKHYDGLPGAMLTVTGFVTGHEALAGRLIHPRGFDIRGCKHLLDAGCGDGRYSKFMLRHADADAMITGFDYSRQMLQRARRRLKTARVSHVAADLTRLPYADQVFDAVVCGWVLEHLPDPRPGLRELSRVMQPGGKLLLMVTEDTFSGAICSRLWHCRTHNRSDLQAIAKECGLAWHREHWLTRWHARIRMGGIIVEMRKEN